MGGRCPTPDSSSFATDRSYSFPVWQRSQHKKILMQCRITNTAHGFKPIGPAGWPRSFCYGLMFLMFNSLSVSMCLALTLALPVMCLSPPVAGQTREPAQSGSPVNPRPCRADSSPAQAEPVLSVIRRPSRLMSAASGINLFIARAADRSSRESALED